jgi:hypothetical protein
VSVNTCVAFVLCSRHSVEGLSVCIVSGCACGSGVFVFVFGFCLRLRLRLRLRLYL